jgi:signal recognition particle subunit SRP54
MVPTNCHAESRASCVSVSRVITYFTLCKAVVSPTTSAKLARKLKAEGRATRLVAADVYRPAAIDQLETLGRDLDVPVYADRTTTDVVRIARAGVEQARKERDRVVIIDTAGRLQIDESLMDELRRVKEAVQPDEILLVADGMTGQDAVRIAQGFNDALGVTGVILTKMDGDARGGAALSIYGATKKPIKYIGVGEKSDALEEFHPDRMAGRILQQGDVLTLVEKAQETFDADEAKRLEKKVRKEGMDLQDFLGAMKQMEKLGSMQNILKMLPGVNSKMMKQASQVDPKRMRHLEAIVLSMTSAERKDSLLNGRAARGRQGQRSVQERLLAQFKRWVFMKGMQGLSMPQQPRREMAVKIRLQDRAEALPSYHIVVADSESPRDDSSAAGPLPRAKDKELT